MFVHIHTTTGWSSDDDIVWIEYTELHLLPATREEGLYCPATLHRLDILPLLLCTEDHQCGGKDDLSFIAELTGVIPIQHFVWNDRPLDRQQAAVAAPSQYTVGYSTNCELEIKQPKPGG